ncbi:MAG: PSD1 and planctomycete cytochrome C domain-containing protein [Pirellulales bacterium]
MRTPLSPAVFRAAASLALVSLLTASARAADKVEYNRDIRPILSDNCFACHGPDAEARQADLRLDLEESAKEYAVVPGEPGVSEVVLRITSEDPEVRMPPAESGKSLTPQQIDMIQRWIAKGAPYQRHWAYVPPQRQPLPDVNNEDWVSNWIDRFILARLEAEGLSPSPEADRVTLIRRLAFDLTGLPPSPEEVDAFLADRDPQAYERLVDRLLSSDRYGERMAVYWLDLVRFADTVGYHGDQDHHISPYRDYVIDAFNDNLPLDRFTREQLAGDLLPVPTIDQRIATGYNRLLQTSHEGGVQPKEYLAIYAADRVRNLSAVWMGATVGCAQCHDHKYDPYTAKDFYSMQAFFADVDEAQHFTRGGDTVPTRRPPEIEVLSKRERERIAELEARLASGDLDEELVKEIEKQIEEIRDGARMTMVTQSIEPRTIRILPRGNWLDDSGLVVQPAVPEMFGDLEVGDRRATRLDLANWLTDAESGVGGLTARVFANRFWYLLLGAGISDSLDDFGGQGEPPVHPELLDQLAVEFYEGGWDVKRLIKQIVMSSTYRQSSRITPELASRDLNNRLYARQSRYRLAAEMIRDNALAIGGLLVLDYGGASVKPYQPEDYFRHLNFPKRNYRHHGDQRQWRRGVYVHWQRQYLHPMLKAFDAPSREECTSQRYRSNTPLAALVLLNDPTFVEAARVFASRVLTEGGESDDARLDYAFRQAVSRPPDDFERQTMLELLDASRDRYAADTEAAQELLAIGEAPPAEELDVAEAAAWTCIARAILNMNETITRN